MLYEKTLYFHLKLWVPIVLHETGKSLATFEFVGCDVPHEIRRSVYFIYENLDVILPA